MEKNYSLFLKKLSATLCMLSFCLLLYCQVDNVVETFSITELAYQSDVSTSDLLAGITPTNISGWNTANGASVQELTDGIHGGNFFAAGNTVQGAWTTVGANATYDLGLGANGVGYDLTSIVSIADWVNAAFGNQSWTIEVQPVGGAFTSLHTLDYQPLTGVGTTKVVIESSSGILASGIQKIRITTNSVNGGANSGAFIWRELDVFGVATVPSSGCVLKIMPMGDSITAGYTDNPTWANHPFMFGYRAELYTLLTNSGYDIQYVGSSPEPWNNAFGDPTNGGTYSPSFDLRNISQDNHHGYGGKTVSFLNTNIASWLAAENPEIILLKIGTNAQDQAGLNTLINYITTNKPDINIIVAQIIPKINYEAGIITYNNYIKNTLVPNYQALGKNVTTVDLYTPFLTNANDPTSINASLFSNGINHPNAAGYSLMANAWEIAINDLNFDVTSFPYSESFEGSVGDWTQASGDDLDFIVNSGGTPSNNTGPSGAIDGNSYIYVEASGNGTGFPNKTAILNSPCLDFGGISNPSLSFNYHMFGSAINSLTVEARVDNEGDWTSIFSETGAQGSDWNTAEIALSAYSGEASTQLRILVVTGSGNRGWQSDIAIDNLAIGENDGNPDPDTCDTIDFNDFTITPFSNQDASGDFSIVDGGAGLSMSNNTWKFIAIDYTVTDNTVIEFDFNSTSQGEIHAIGFENDNTLTANRYFKVHGTQNYGVTNFDDYAGGTKNYVIPVGSFYTGDADRLVFINDNDAGSGNNSIFSNVKIYEGSCGGSVANLAAKAIPILGDTVEESSLSTSVSILPTYVSDRFTISVNRASSATTYATIYSTLGRKVAQLPLQNGVNQFSSQSLSMETGMYLIRISDDRENSVVERIVVE